MPRLVVRIDVPAGETHVQVGLIPNWIADSLVHVPLSATPRKLLGVRKWTILGDNHTRDDGPLTSEDWALLDTIYGKLPALSKDTTKEKWPDYEKAFEDTPNKPSWMLEPLFDDPVGDAKRERNEIRSKYFDQIEKDVINGKLKAQDEHLVPTQEFQHSTLVRVDDVRDYLAELGFEVREVREVDAEAQGEQPNCKANTGRNTAPNADAGGKPRVYWRIVLEKNIKKIDSDNGGKAQVTQAIKWLKALRDKRIPNKGAGDELIYLDDSNTEQHVKKATVSNALSDARRSKK